MSSHIKISGASYIANSDSIQGSYQVKSHTNLAVTGVANNSAPILADFIVVVATDYVRWNANTVATAAGLILPPGYSALVWNRGDFLSVLQLANPCEVCIIIPE